MNVSQNLRENKFRTLPATGNPFACILCATNDLYAVAIMVAVSRLKKLGISPDIDIVAMHSRVSKCILNSMRSLGISTVSVRPPLSSNSHYFRHSLLKLRIFQFAQYERIVYLDADSLPLKNLSLLFEMKFNEPIAMPRAYWLAQGGTSALIVAHPSAGNWQSLVSWLDDAVACGRGIPADMEVLNSVFKSQIHYLPSGYFRLNGDWGDRNFLPVYGDPEMGLEKVQLVHFTDLGKPWSYHPQMVRRLRPNARRRYYEFWDMWWATREELSQTSSAIDRFALAFLKREAVFENLLRLPLTRTAARMSCAHHSMKD